MCCLEIYTGYLVEGAEVKLEARHSFRHELEDSEQWKDLEYDNHIITNLKRKVKEF